jgi:hypothetical protein
VVRANCGGPINTITLQNISSENTHNIDIISQFIANLYLGDPLEAGEEFLQYVFDRLEIRPWCEPARTGLTVPSGKVFNEHVARDGAVLLQALRGRDAFIRHETSWVRSAFCGGKRAEAP